MHGKHVRHEEVESFSFSNACGRRSPYAQVIKRDSAKFNQGPGLDLSIRQGQFKSFRNVSNQAGAPPVSANACSPTSGHWFRCLCCTHKRSKPSLLSSVSLTRSSSTFSWLKGLTRTLLTTCKLGPELPKPQTVNPQTLSPPHPKTTIAWLCETAEHEPL